MPRRRKRLDPAVFRLPVDEIRQGFYTDKYFERTREILRADTHSSRALMQVTGKAGGYLSGVDEAIAILKLCAEDWPSLTVTALYEGDEFEDWDTVMTIEGPYECFAHLETLYLGVLGRRTRICTNTRRLVEAARPKPVLFFGARHDIGEFRRMRVGCPSPAPIITKPWRSNRRRVNPRSPRIPWSSRAAAGHERGSATCGGR